MARGFFGPPRHPAIETRTPQWATPKVLHGYSVFSFPSSSAQVPAGVSLTVPACPAFCALAKPWLSILGLGPGELAPRTRVLLGPRVSPCTGDPAADCLKHLAGQARGPSAVFDGGRNAGRAQ